MRISTSAFHRIPSDAISRQQAQLAKTQNEVATQKRIQTPSDDPIGAVHLLELNRTLAESDQYGKNANAATARLSTEEQALSDAGSILQRARELLVEANSSSVDATGRNAIAVELQQRVQELVDVANRRDGNSEFLFSGYATNTQPFARAAASVTYAGNQGSRLQQIGPTQNVADSDSGFDVFLNIPQGNGTFVTAAPATNTGTASIDTGSVLNAGAWVPDTYTITFVAPDSYQITNSAAAVVVAAVPGNYKSGNAISFNGVQVTVSGTPVAADTLTVTASQKESIFTSLDKAIAALSAAKDAPPQRAQFATSMANALSQLDQADNHLLNVRSSVGARLAMLEDSESTRQDSKVELQTAISNLQDVDYAEAITRMNRQYLGLQAAQQSYAKLAQMSLFNFL